MKRSLIIALIIAIFSVNNVYASTVLEPNQEGYEELEAEFNKGIQTTTVSSPQTMVTLYGYSDCDGTSCKLSYNKDDSSMTAEDVLSRSVICSNGEKYITYQSSVASGREGFNIDNKNKYVGKVYWTEDYFVDCTSNSTGNNTIEAIPDNGGTSNGGTSNGGTSNGGTSNGGTSNGGISNGGTSNGGTSNGEYNSSTPTDPSETGVETYYIILGIIAILTYVSMYVIKRYNLFKKI